MDNNNSMVSAMKQPEKNEQGSFVDLSDTKAVKDKYGEVYEVTTVVDEDDANEGRRLVYYFKKPSTASFNRYLKTAGKNMATSTTTFVMDNIVDEQAEAISNECGKYPGLALGLGQKLLSAIGLGDNVNFRKL